MSREINSGPVVHANGLWVTNLAANPIKGVNHVFTAIMVMDAGRLVEQGTTADLLERPQTPAAKALCAHRNCVLNVNALSVLRGSRVTLDEITLSLPAGGESGASKSTLIGAILGLVKPTAGDIIWNDTAVRNIRPALVMQEPRAAFNPALSLRRSVMEPVVAQGMTLAKDRMERLCTGLELIPDLLDRRPHEVSIGQAQRAGILRALIASPPLVLFDEPLSALDAVTQKHTAQVIADVQAAESFAALIVTHDLGYAVAHADQIAVLKDGRMEEVADAETFALNPQSAYCRRLRDAAIALSALEAVA